MNKTNDVDGSRACGCSQVVYRARSSEWQMGVEKMTVEKTTDKSVWINGRRLARKSDRMQIFDSFDEAKQWLIDHFGSLAEQAHQRLVTVESLCKTAASINESDVKESNSMY